MPKKPDTPNKEEPSRICLDCGFLCFGENTEVTRPMRIMLAAHGRGVMFDHYEKTECHKNLWDWSLHYSALDFDVLIDEIERNRNKCDGFFKHIAGLTPEQHMQEFLLKQRGLAYKDEKGQRQESLPEGAVMFKDNFHPVIINKDGGRVATPQAAKCLEALYKADKEGKPLRNQQLKTRTQSKAKKFNLKQVFKRGNDPEIYQELISESTDVSSGQKKSFSLNEKYIYQSSDSQE